MFMQDEWRPGLYYHVIGKAIPGGILFAEEHHYRQFLRHYLRDRLTLIFQVYVYCLLPNHFHLVIRTRHSSEIRARLAGPKRLRNHQRAYFDGETTWREFVIGTFNGAINGYAQYYNHQVGRSGQLFVKPTLHGLSDKGEPGVEFSRRQACYVGLNYYKHGLAPAEAKYAWSSLRAPKYYIIEPEIELHWGSEEEYVAKHVEYLRRYGAAMLAFDEEEFFRSLTPRKFIEAKARWAIEEEGAVRRQGLR